jgi:Tfp pilus assembly protein FimT
MWSCGWEEPGKRVSRQGTLSNNAFKLTRSIGLARMEALRATMRWPRRPSQLNAMLDGRWSTPVERR